MAKKGSSGKSGTPGMGKPVNPAPPFGGKTGDTSGSPKP